MAESKRSDFKGVNPCGEICLDNQGVCNLVEINLLSFVKYKVVKNLKEEFTTDIPYLDVDNLYKSVAYSTRHNLRITNITMWHPEWDKVQKRDRLLGVSLTGIVETQNKLKWNQNQINELYKNLKAIVDFTAEYYSYFLGIPNPLLKTTIKPSGTLSNLPGVSSGIHAPYAPFYIRRIRVSAVDPIAKVLQKLNVPVTPENGYKDLESSPIWVFSFYIKTNATIKATDESAITQLERYKSVMEHYVQHNCSVTVTFKIHEVPEIIEWIKNNQNCFVGISFLPTYEGGAYPNLPYEAITEEQYNELVKDQVTLSEKELNTLISQFEFEEKEYELENDCQSGACPVR